MGAQSRRGSTWVPIGLVGLAIALGAAWLAGQQGDGRAALNEPGDVQTVPVRALTVLPDLQAPTDAQTDAQGQLWVALRDGNRVSKRLPDGSWQTVAGTGQPGRTGDGGPASEAQLNSPDGMAFAPDGTLFIADRINHVIRAVDPSSQRIRTVAGTGSAARTQDDEGNSPLNVTLYGPRGVVSSPDGAVWFIAGQHRADKVYRLAPDGNRLDVAYDQVEASPAWGHNKSAAYIAELASDAQGRIHIVDNANVRLLRLDAWTGPPTNPRAPAATVLAGNGQVGLIALGAASDSPMGLVPAMALDPRGQVHLYESTGEGQVLRLDAQTGQFVSVLAPNTQVKVPGQPPERLDLPQTRLRFGPDGTLHLADHRNKRVLLIKP